MARPLGERKAQSARPSRDPLLDSFSHLGLLTEPTLKAKIKSRHDLDIGAVRQRRLDLLDHRNGVRFQCGQADLHGLAAGGTHGVGDGAQVLDGVLSLERLAAGVAAR
ncbi:hypothetical protein [Streptosporangium sp. NPDC087985]|uniref:hypothetical protein n=1 Tax=Streptosporangium sp. NPDC087985 TaxID=3366196 RepID=UPI0037F64198